MTNPPNQAPPAIAMGPHRPAGEQGPLPRSIIIITVSGFTEDRGAQGESQRSANAEDDLSKRPPSKRSAITPSGSATQLVGPGLYPDLPASPGMKRMKQGI